MCAVIRLQLTNVGCTVQRWINGLLIVQCSANKLPLPSCGVSVCIVNLPRTVVALGKWNRVGKRCQKNLRNVVVMSELCVWPFHRRVASLWWCAEYEAARESESEWVEGDHKSICENQFYPTIVNWKSSIADIILRPSYWQSVIIEIMIIYFGETHFRLLLPLSGTMQRIRGINN